MIGSHEALSPRQLTPAQQWLTDATLLGHWCIPTPTIPTPCSVISLKRETLPLPALFFAFVTVGRDLEKLVIFFSCFLSLLSSMSFQNSVNSLSFLNLMLLSPLHRREWLSWVEIITQQDFNLMASVLIKGRNQRHHTHTHICAHAHTYTHMRTHTQNKVGDTRTVQPKLSSHCLPTGDKKLGDTGSRGFLKVSEGINLDTIWFHSFSLQIHEAIHFSGLCLHICGTSSYSPGKWTRVHTCSGYSQTRHWQVSAIDQSTG